jgi:colicin import membrane protein
MNKAYIIWPLLALLLFGGRYWYFNQGFIEREKAKAVQEQLQKKERIEADIARRIKAVQDATKAQQERIAARHAKEEQEQKENDLRNQLMERRQHAFDDVNRHLRPQLDRHKADADSVKGEIAQLELQQKQFQDEEVFLRKYTREAEANVKTYYDMMEKIKAADEAHALADAVAKAAKKD